MRVFAPEPEEEGDSCETEEEEERELFVERRVVVKCPDWSSVLLEDLQTNS